MIEFNKAKLAENVQKIRDNVRKIAENCGRNVDTIKIVPATKYVDDNVCNALIELGFKELGENRIQVLEGKAEQMPDFKGWHFFGHLQKNKVRKALKYCKTIETVDSVALVERIAFIADDENIDKVEIFIEVKTSGEENKTGADVADVPAIINAIKQNPRLGLTGFMTMAALEDPEESRKYFKELREFRDKTQSELGIQIPHLSMGMSGDYEYAIEEGATIIRIGSLIYEGIFADN